MTLDLDALEKVAQEAKSRNDQSFGLDGFGDLLIGAGAVLALIAELKDHRRTIRIWKVGEREAHLEAERDALQAKLDALEAATVEPEWEYGQGYRNSDDTVFLWTEATSLEHAKELATPSRHKDRECPVPLRRRKAGPWEPVGGESA